MPTPTRRLTPSGTALPARHAALAALLAGAAVASAQEAPPPDIGTLTDRIVALARDGARAPGATPARVAVEVGQLDPRLKLAPCQKIEPYLPNGVPAWGRSRVGLRCVQGPKAWNVTLPVTIHVYAQALVVSAALPAGTVLSAADLSQAEVDLAAEPGAAIGQMGQAVGRTLARSLSAGSTLRMPDLKVRQWFAAGDTVKLVASGPGWRIVSEGQAITPGLEGQVARVRTDSGRVLQGRAVADREMEVSL